MKFSCKEEGKRKILVIDGEGCYILTKAKNLIEFETEFDKDMADLYIEFINIRGRTLTPEDYDENGNIKTVLKLSDFYGEDYDENKISK